MKSSLKNTVKNVYKNTNNDVSVNKNIKDISNRLKDNSLYDDFVTLSDRKPNKSVGYVKSTSTDISNINLYFYILLPILIVSAISMAVYIYRDYIKDYFFKDEKKKMEDIEKDVIEKDNSINEHKDKISSLENKIKYNEDKIKELTNNLNNKKEEKNKKIDNNKSKESIKDNNIGARYSESNIVKEDTYCYIGRDNNQRHCIKAYPGEVCQSGDVYNRLDKCIHPKLRV